jgi:hypothetical protein
LLLNQIHHSHQALKNDYNVLPDVAALRQVIHGKRSEAIRIVQVGGDFGRAAVQTLKIG